MNDAPAARRTACPVTPPGPHILLPPVLVILDILPEGPRIGTWSLLLTGVLFPCLLSLAASVFSGTYNVVPCHRVL
jgi:hypothetical protein